MEIIDIKDSIVSEQIKAKIDEMVNAYCDELIKQDQEITRLNNIINEMEKEIYYVIDKMNNSLIEIEGRGYYYQDLLPLECLIYKLKELKENK